MRRSPALLRWFYLAYPLFRASSISGNARFVTTGWQTRHTSRPFRKCGSCQHRGTTSPVGAHHHQCSSLGLLSSTARFFSTTNNNNNNNADILTSTSSNTVKRFKELQQKAKKRREARETVIEGPRMVLDLLRHPSTQHLIQHIIVSTDLDDKLQQEVQKEAAKSSWNIQLQMAMPHVLKACSDTVTPQGIVARVKLPDWDAIAHTTGAAKNRNASLKEANRAPLYLVLDGVSDPGNVGTLLRSSVAVGVSAVLLLPGCCDVWNPKAVRSAMSASFLVPTFALGGWEEAMQRLMNDWSCSNFWAATMLDDKEEGVVVSLPHYDVSWSSGPNALIIGSEGKGLSQDIRHHLGGKGSSGSSSIQAVHVPMQEDAIESLNAGVCGSVILFEYMRQCSQH